VLAAKRLEEDEAARHIQRLVQVLGAEEDQRQAETIVRRIPTEAKRQRTMGGIPVAFS
jgi:hypothetical protein